MCDIIPIYEVIATGLYNPSGFTFDTDGGILISQPGLSDPTIPPTGGFTHTGRISKVDGSGQRVILNGVLGMQGGVDVEPENVGLADITELDGDVYILKNFGPATGTGGTDSVTGVYRYHHRGLVQVVDLAAFELANLPITSPNSNVTLPPPLIGSAPSAFAMVGYRHKLYITNGHTDTIDVLDPCTGNIRRLVNFSDALTPGAPPYMGAHPVLTGITVNPRDGRLIVIQITPYGSQPTLPPGPPNNASIYSVDRCTGDVKVIATGYSYGQGVAVDIDGSVYITQFTTFISGTTGEYTGPGSLVRWRPDTGEFETILTPLILPGAVHIHGDYLYVLQYTQTGDYGQGTLIRLPLDRLRISECG